MARGERRGAELGWPPPMAVLRGDGGVVGGRAAGDEGEGEEFTYDTEEGVVIVGDILP
jgi:hypothetical protein